MINPVPDDSAKTVEDKRPVLPAANTSASQARALLWRFLPLGIIILALAGVWFSGVTHFLTFEYLLNSRARLAEFIQNNLILSLVSYAAIYIAAVALSVPGALILTIAGGFLFGGWLGGSITAVSATIGASVLFVVARTALGELLASRAGPWLERLRGGFREDEASYMLFLRLVPVFPFWLVNLAPAFLGVRFGTFVWTTFVGVLPGTFAYSLAGAGIDSVGAAQQKIYQACVAAGGEGCSLSISPYQLVTRELVLAFAAIGLAALIPVVVKKWRARKMATNNAEKK